MFKTGAYGYLTDYLWWYVVILSLHLHTVCFFKLCPAERFPRLRLVAGNALVTLCLLSLIALGAETYLRFVSVTTDSYGASLTADRWIKAYADRNSMLCRDKEWDPVKAAGVRRIAFLGDSFTFGWGINDQADLFTSLLQDRFDRTAPGTVEVMNVAWPNWDTDRQIEAARVFVADYGVDEFVLCYLPNDIITALPIMKELDLRALPDQYLINTETSFLVDYFYHRVVPRRFSSVRNYYDWIWDGYKNPEVWASQQSRLDELRAVCDDNHATLRVALLPFLRVWGERFDGPALHRQLADYFRSRNLEVVDLLPAVEEFAPEELVVNSVDAHPNERAHRLFAEGIWAAFYAGN